MLDIQDLQAIHEAINEIISSIENVKTKHNIKTINIDNFDSTLRNNDVVFIDSSYVHNIIGPISYIYIRAVGVEPNNIITQTKLYIFTDTFFTVNTKNGYDKLSLQDVAEMLSKNLEYSIADISKAEYVVIDGSILADYIVVNKNYVFENRKIQFDYDNFKEKYKYTFLNRKLLSIAKRIVQAHFITENEDISDFVLLLNTFPEREFITSIYKKRIENSEIFEDPIEIKASYFRVRLNDHIYRLESNPNVDDTELLSFLKEFIWRERKYPFGLKMAHYKSKITSKEKKLIEEVIKKEIGLSKTIDIETK